MSDMSELSESGVKEADISDKTDIMYEQKKWPKFVLGAAVVIASVYERKANVAETEVLQAWSCLYEWKV